MCNHASVKSIEAKFCACDLVANLVDCAEFCEIRLNGVVATSPPPLRHFVCVTFIAFTTALAVRCCAVLMVLLTLMHVFETSSVGLNLSQNFCWLSFFELLSIA